MPLVSTDDAWVLWAVILSAVALSIYLEQNFQWAARISGPVIALLLAMILTNVRFDKLLAPMGYDSRYTGILPAEAPTYDAIQKYLVPVAVALLLFRANLRAVVTTSPTMLAAFGLATVGSLVGTVLAAILFHGHMKQVPEASGLMAASYIGGGVNFFAVQQTYGISSDLASPLLVADNFVMAAFFLVLLVIADLPFVRARYRHPHSLDVTADSRAQAAAHWRPKPIGLLDIARALAVAAVIAATSAWIAAKVAEVASPAASRSSSLVTAALGSLGSSPYIWITLITVSAATVFPRALGQLAGAEELGGYLLYVFLFVIGVPADLWSVLASVPEMFGFCLVIAVANLAVVLVGGRLFRLNLEELLLASNATLGGPPTAAAMAISKGWSQLVLPGILAGILGYVIGTAIGIVVIETFRRML